MAASRALRVRIVLRREEPSDAPRRPRSRRRRSDVRRTRSNSPAGPAPVPHVIPHFFRDTPEQRGTAPVDAGLEWVGCPAALRSLGDGDQVLGNEESGDEVGPLRTSAACAGPNQRTLLTR